MKRFLKRENISGFPNKIVYPTSAIACRIADFFFCLKYSFVIGLIKAVLIKHKLHRYSCDNINGIIVQGGP